MWGAFVHVCCVFDLFQYKTNKWSDNNPGHVPLDSLEPQPGDELNWDGLSSDTTLGSGGCPHRAKRFPVDSSSLTLDALPRTCSSVLTSPPLTSRWPALLLFPPNHRNHSSTIASQGFVFLHSVKRAALVNGDIRLTTDYRSRRVRDCEFSWINN